MKHKIIQLLKTFTPKEVKDFDKFLRSPYFNESSKVHSLYKILLKYYPEFDSSKLTEENLSRQLNPTLQYNKSTFKSLLFDLGNLADEYLTLLGFSQNGVGNEDFLRNQYFKRRLYKFFRQNIDESETAFLEKEPTLSSYIDLIKLQNDKLVYLASNKSNLGRDFIRELVELHSERSRLLTEVFTNEVIRGFDNLKSAGWSHDLKDLNNYTGKLFNLIDFQKILISLLVETKNVRRRLNLELNLAMFRMYSEADKKFYYEYKDLVLRNTSLIPAQLVNNHLLRLIKYCQQKIASDNSGKFREELFEILKFQIENDHFTNSLNHFLSADLYRMVLITALEVDRNDWALDFINKYHNELHPDKRENMKDFGMALYNFHSGNFNEALQNLNKIRLDQFFLKMDYKNLMLMIYYELGMYESAISLIDSYKHFVSNGDVLNDRMNLKLKNFIFIVEKLLKYRTENKPPVMHLIESRLNTDIPNKKWTLAKVKEIDSKVTVRALDD